MRISDWTAAKLALNSKVGKRFPELAELKQEVMDEIKRAGFPGIGKESVIHAVHIVPADPKLQPRHLMLLTRCQKKTQPTWQRFSG